MCRVLLMNKEGEKDIDKIYGLSKYLKYLEDQLGGHGNGFALMKGGKIIRFEKGLNLDVRDIAKEVKKVDYDWFLFHTRLASVGDKTNENCHPFRRGNFILAMNGTERSASFISRIKDITDTEAILDIINKYNLGLPALKCFSSIFMGFYKNKPFVVADNTHNIKIYKNDKNNALIFASNFPVYITKNIYNVNECFSWNGEEFDKSLLTKRNNRFTRTLSYRNLVYHNDLYDQCYFDFEDYSKGESLCKDII